MIVAVMVQVFIGLGFVFALIGHLGVLLLPDVYTRLQASSTSTTTSVISFFIAAMLDGGFSIATGKIVAIMVFFLLSSPVSTHLVAKHAWNQEIAPWRRRKAK